MLRVILLYNGLLVWIAVNVAGIATSLTLVINLVFSSVLVVLVGQIYKKTNNFHILGKINMIYPASGHKSMVNPDYL